MPGTTPKGGLSYPLSSDPLKDHASTVEKLAKGVQAGTVPITLAASSSATGSVTFDPPFAAPPVVVGVCDNSFFNVSVSSISATGASVAIRHIDAQSSSSTFNVRWVAVGEVA